MDLGMKKIIDLFLNESSVTSLRIAEVMNVSEKTARKRCKDLADEIKQHGGKLTARQRKGWSLDILDEEQFYQWYSQGGMGSGLVPDTSAGREEFLLRHLLAHSGYVKIEDLCDLLYVSRNTITADLKRVESILQMYHLSLARRPNYGILLTGEEFDRRRCLVNLSMKHLPIKGKVAEEQIIIAQIMRNTVRDYRIQMTEHVFQEMVLHAYVTNERIRQCHFMKYDSQARQELMQNLVQKAIQAADYVAELIENRLGIYYATDERLYLAIIFSGKVTMDSPQKFGSNRVISSHIDELVLKMLEAVYKGYKLDFLNNLELRMALNQHMVPLDIRIRYGIVLRNPILDQVKKNYTFAYSVAVSACMVLQQHYQKPISEDEIGYIAVLFALAIEKQDKEITKKNIVVVCISGKGTSQMFLYRYKQAFGKYINKIYECSVFDLAELDFEAMQIDYVFTTVPLDMILPVPIFEVTLLLSHEEVDRYRRIFEEQNSEFLYHYFDRRLFLSDVKAASKEEVLKVLCDHAAKYHPVPNHFYDLVMMRENAGQTDFGNLVAIPHPYYVVSQRKFIMAAILEQPIWWGHNDVQIVLLISLSKEEDTNVEQFYRTITNFLSDKGLVDRVIQEPTYESLIEQLIEAGKR